MLVMELLGPSLRGLFEKMNLKFTIKTVMQLAQQMIQRLEAIHSKGIINRDIKPDNFLMGRKGSPGEKVLYMIDFGLAKSYYQDDEDGNPTKNHIARGKSDFLIGTLRYCSINAHELVTLSRRDDLEPVGYALVYLAKGRLPWQGQTGDDVQRQAKIHQIKKRTTTKRLCEELPECFAAYVDYVRTKLTFKQTPDYGYLVNLFKEGYEEEDKNNFDWDKLEKDPSDGIRGGANAKN